MYLVRKFYNRNLISEGTYPTIIADVPFHYRPISSSGVSVLFQDIHEPSIELVATKTSLDGAVSEDIGFRHLPLADLLWAFEGGENDLRK